MPGTSLSPADKPVRWSQKVTAMVDWTILSPSFLTLVVEWIAAVVTASASGLVRPTNTVQRNHP